MALRTALIAAAVVAVLAVGPATNNSGPTPVAAAEPAAKGQRPVFDVKVLPFLQKYCLGCHSDKKEAGGLSLERFRDEASARGDRKTWEKVGNNVRGNEMPPKSKPQPSAAERTEFTAWVEGELNRVECGLAKEPGRPTIRRLNRSEYNNTIRDLLAVRFQPADDFPSDDVGYGFDNIGDVLSMPPILFEKYLEAADRILEQAIVTERPIKSDKRTYRSQALISTLGRGSKEKGRIYLTEKGAAILQQDFDYEGDYVFRAHVFGERSAGALPKLLIRVDGKDLKTFDVTATSADKPATLEARAHVGPGKHAVSLQFVNGYDHKAKDSGKKGDRSLSIQGLDVEGPFHPVPKPLPESHRKIMIAKPAGPKPADREAAARRIIEPFARNAYRRPVQAGEVDRLMKLFQLAESQGEPFEEAIRVALKAVLVSPHFLFKVETDPQPDSPASHLVNDWELATRLSYFLWSSMPDGELFGLAEKGTLRGPAVLDAQVKRMLKDPKSRALTENFAAQWLQLRTLQTATPDRVTYPEYRGGMRNFIVRETELYFEHIVREDRSVLEFLDSDYTFLNAPLARFYGIQGVSGLEFQKVQLKDPNRGGVVTQASILTLTSNPTRTSPVKRGKWILENILGTPPPPPPPDVPELKDGQSAASSGSLRQRMEAHRANTICASCHQRMDPLGFGLENFDGVGRWRTTDGKFPIDASGELPDGARFAGPAELRKVLLGKADLFRRCLAEKVLTYSLGRGLEYYDRCAVDELVTALRSNQDRFSALVAAVVKSDPFQKRRGKRSE